MEQELNFKEEQQLGLYIEQALEVIKYSKWMDDYLKKHHENRKEHVKTAECYMMFEGYIEIIKNILNKEFE